MAQEVGMLKNPLSKMLALYLIVSLFALSFPVQSWAMLVPTAQPEERTADLSKIRTTLESSVILQRLLDYGLTPEETTRRLESLSDEQIHRFASQLDAVQAGGDALGDVIVILLIVIIVIVILELTGHKVIMRK